MLTLFAHAYHCQYRFDVPVYLKQSSRIAILCQGSCLCSCLCLCYMSLSNSLPESKCRVISRVRTLGMELPQLPHGLVCLFQGPFFSFPYFLLLLCSEIVWLFGCISLEFSWIKKNIWDMEYDYEKVRLLVVNSLSQLPQKEKSFSYSLWRGTYL